MIIEAHLMERHPLHLDSKKPHAHPALQQYPLSTRSPPSDMYIELLKWPMKTHWQQTPTHLSHPDINDNK